MPFISFSCLIVLGKTSKTMLNKTGKRRHACLVPDHCCCCSVTKSCPTLRPHGLQHARLTCPSLSPGVISNTYPSRFVSYAVFLKPTFVSLISSIAFLLFNSSISVLIFTISFPMFALCVLYLLF